MNSLPSLLVAAATAFISISAANAALVFTIEESGTDVVITGSGSLNLTGLSGPTSASEFAVVEPSLPGLMVGVSGLTDPYQTNSFTGPADFGTGGANTAASSTGDIFGFDVIGSDIFLITPDGYVSGSSLNGTATWNTNTLAGLGITPGSYVWTLTGNSDTITVNAIPEPTTAAFMLPAALLILGYRRRVRVGA